MPRKGNSRNFQKRVQDIVRKELAEEIEEKTGLIGGDAVGINANIPTGDISATPNQIQLMPLLSQVNADKQYNGRSGNEVRLKHLNLKMLLQYKNPASGEQASSSIGVRVMILRQKDQNSAVGAIQNFQGDKLIENGQITTPGPALFTGKTINLYQKINREQFSVRYDKVHYMSRQFSETRGTQGPSAFNERNYITPPKPVFINKTLRFGKRGLKLTYGDGLSDNATNFPYFVVIGYASTLDDAVPDNDLVEYTYTAHATYTDV